MHVGNWAPDDQAELASSGRGVKVFFQQVAAARPSIQSLSSSQSGMCIWEPIT